jgi:ATP-dependent Lon protease
MNTRSKIKCNIIDDNDNDNDIDNDIDNDDDIVDDNDDDIDSKLKRKRDVDLIDKEINTPKKKTKSNLNDLIVQYIVHQANNQANNQASDTDNIESDSDESDASDEKYKLDKYDKNFQRLTNDKKEDIDIDYFSKLKIYKKKKILSEIKNINDINTNNIPLKFKIYESNMDINTKSIAISQIKKIDELDPSSGEYGKVNQWINGLIQIPFKKYTKLPINNNSCIFEKKKFLKNTNDTLNRAIYGHKEAKSHILQVVSKWIKNPKSNGNILALQGPMGNGKTTLVKEGIAKAINRPFAFITLGGASDSSFFDGHNFTYEGSRWGRIVEILIESKCMNPIFYFDELDKISETEKGTEIIHLLTHLTDTSQNDRFQDNYFSGINLDLSKALFIFSFNDESKIDKILKDRMHVIHTRGFKTDDKIHIVKDYLLPELLNTYKYHDNITFDDKIIECIIENYTQKEEGVRNLKRCLETIISKVNMYELLYDDINKCCSIDLDYKLDNFCIPYIIKKDDLDILLKKNNETDKPPEHMYV